MKPPSGGFFYVLANHLMHGLTPILLMNLIAEIQRCPYRYRGSKRTEEIYGAISDSDTNRLPGGSQTDQINARLSTLISKPSKKVL